MCSDVFVHESRVVFWRMPFAAAAIVRSDHLFPPPPLLPDLAQLDGISLIKLALRSGMFSPNLLNHSRLRFAFALLGLKLLFRALECLAPDRGRLPSRSTALNTRRACVQNDLFVALHASDRGSRLATPVPCERDPKSMARNKRRFGTRLAAGRINSEQAVCNSMVAYKFHEHATAAVQVQLAEKSMEDKWSLTQHMPLPLQGYRSPRPAI